MSFSEIMLALEQVWMWVAGGRGCRKKVGHGKASVGRLALFSCYFVCLKDNVVNLNSLAVALVFSRLGETG